MSRCQRCKNNIILAVWNNYWDVTLKVTHELRIFQAPSSLTQTVRLHPVLSPVGVLAFRVQRSMMTSPSWVISSIETLISVLLRTAASFSPCGSFPSAPIGSWSGPRKTAPLAANFLANSSCLPDDFRARISSWYFWNSAFAGNSLFLIL